MPRPAKVDKRVAVTDAFSGGLLRSAAAQAKASASLPPRPGSQGRRADDHRLPARRWRRRALHPADPHRRHHGQGRGQEILLPAEYKKLTGKAKATKAVTLTSLEPVILLVSNTGTVSVIGAAEHLIAGKASRSTPRNVECPALWHNHGHDRSDPAGTRGAVDLSATATATLSRAQRGWVHRRRATGPGWTRRRTHREQCPGGALAHPERRRDPRPVVLGARATRTLLDEVTSIAAGLQGRLLVITADVTGDPALMQMFQPLVVQAFGQLAVPATFGLLQGQPVPLFPGMPSGQASGSHRAVAPSRGRQRDHWPSRAGGG
ncbi:MAG: hypothetical protein IPL94_09905 [Tetrasphaera sp.]|nr:hypothetical protein [Tetrasphaera sp.]